MPGHERENKYVFFRGTAQGRSSSAITCRCALNTGSAQLEDMWRASIIPLIMLNLILATLTARDFRRKENDVACKSILYFTHTHTHTHSLPKHLMEARPVDQGDRARALCVCVETFLQNRAKKGWISHSWQRREYDCEFLIDSRFPL